MEERGNTNKQTQKYLEKNLCRCHFVHPKSELNDLGLKPVLGIERTIIHGTASFSECVENYTPVISQ